MLVAGVLICIQGLSSRALSIRLSRWAAGWDAPCRYPVNRCRSGGDRPALSQDCWKSRHSSWRGWGCSNNETGRSRVCLTKMRRTKREKLHAQHAFNDRGDVLGQLQSSTQSRRLPDRSFRNTSPMSLSRKRLLRSGSKRNAECELQPRNGMFWN
jgi:hypothetical protein